MTRVTPFETDSVAVPTQHASHFSQVISPRQGRPRPAIAQMSRVRLQGEAGQTEATEDSQKSLAEGQWRTLHLTTYRSGAHGGAASGRHHRFSQVSAENPLRHNPSNTTNLYHAQIQREAVGSLSRIPFVFPLTRSLTSAMHFPPGQNASSTARGSTRRSGISRKTTKKGVTEYR